MDADERAAIKAAFPQHGFMRVIKDGWQAILAIPRQQSAPEKQAAVELWHGSTVRV